MRFARPRRTVYNKWIKTRRSWLLAYRNTRRATDFEASGVTLNDWQPIDVFEQRCAAANITGEALQDLTASFMELLNKEKT